MLFLGFPQTVHAKEIPYIEGEYVPFIKEACEKYNVSPYLVAAIIWTESRWQADASNGTCIGLMQVSEKWHKQRMIDNNVTDLYDPEGNILVGTEYLSELMHKYTEPALCLMVYNGTSKAEQKYADGIVSAYAKKVLEIEEVFKNCYNLETTRGKMLKLSRPKRELVYSMNKGQEKLPQYVSHLKNYRTKE